MPSTPPQSAVKMSFTADYASSDDEDPFFPAAYDSTGPSSAASTPGDNERSHPPSKKADRSMGTTAQGNDAIFIADNPFESENSKALFDAIDQIQSCGAGEYIDIPQLIVVGGQSAGKSSLLQTLTDIPFPVKTDACTRFATRIISRRTAPGTPSKVRISIVRPDFRIEGLKYVPTESYKNYEVIMETLTAEQLLEIIEEVSTKYLQIVPGKLGISKKNFAIEVLKVEISGPTRTHFSIVDIPGFFTNDCNVKDGEMEAVQDMVTAYMKQPANIVICVADATSDLSNQPIVKLATQNVEKTRLIGVFTKCDLLKKSQANSVVALAKGQGEGLKQLIHHGLFVVRNRADGDEDDPGFDLQKAEADLFLQAPWTAISKARRGSVMLKKYLGALLCTKIRAAFPCFLANLRRLLDEAEADKTKLGGPRGTQELRRAYLAELAQKYEEDAREALQTPWRLKSEHARIRNLVKHLNNEFDKTMRERGHEHKFEDHDLKNEECIRQLGESVAKLDEKAPLHYNPEPIHESSELFDKIRYQIELCSATELPGMVHPDVIHRLYEDQTQKWKSISEEHLMAVAETVSRGTKELLNTTCPSSGETAILHEELWLILDALYNKTLNKALSKLRAYCDGDQKKLLQTTNPKFLERITLLRTLRLLEAVKRSSWIWHSKREVLPAVDIGFLIYQQADASSLDNKASDVHDTLRVYYEFSLDSFIRYIVNTIVEDFLEDTGGPLKRLTREYIEDLPANEVDRLGQESTEIVERRDELDGRITTLRAAEKIARASMAKTAALV